MTVSLPPPPKFTPANWYWIVAGSVTQVYSSAAVAYVLVANATYVTWIAAGNKPTKIAVEQDLWDLLSAQGIAIPQAASISDTQKNSFYDAGLTPLFRALVLSLNDGSFVPGSNLTGAQIKAIFKAKM